MYVSESGADNPNASIFRRSQDLGLAYGIMWRILQLDLQLHPYKVHLRQQLKPAEHSQRRRYAEWVLEQQAVDGNFSNKIFFTDEAHLGGYVNKQNYRIWGPENLEVIEERSLHSYIHSWPFPSNPSVGIMT